MRIILRLSSLSNLIFLPPAPLSYCFYYYRFTQTFILLLQLFIAAKQTAPKLTNFLKNIPLFFMILWVTTKFCFPLYLLEHWNNNELQNSLIHRVDIWLSLPRGSSAGAVNQTSVFPHMGLSMWLSGLCRAQLMGSKKKCPQLQIS